MLLCPSVVRELDAFLCVRCSAVYHETENNDAKLPPLNKRTEGTRAVLTTPPLRGFQLPQPLTSYDAPRTSDLTGDPARSCIGRPPGEYSAGSASMMINPLTYMWYDPSLLPPQSLRSTINVATLSTRSSQMSIAVTALVSSADVFPGSITLVSPSAHPWVRGSGEVTREISIHFSTLM